MTIPNDFNPLGISEDLDSTPSIRIKYEAITGAKKAIKLSFYRPSRNTQVSGLIDWGDGTSTNIDFGTSTSTSISFSKTYDTALFSGLQPIVKITGSGFSKVSTTSTNYPLFLIQILEVMPGVSYQLLGKPCPITFIDTRKIKNFDKLTDYSYFFYDSILQEIILNLNKKDSINLSSMCSTCPKLTKISSANGIIFDSNVTNMTRTFQGCYELVEIEGLMNISNVTNMNYAFTNANKLRLDLNSIQPGLKKNLKLKNALSAFANCRELFGTFDKELWKQLIQNSFVSNFDSCFYDCLNIENFEEVFEGIGRTLSRSRSSSL